MTLQERSLLKNLCKKKVKEQQDRINDCVHALANPHLSKTSTTLIEAKLKYHYGQLSHYKAELKKQIEAYLKEASEQGEQFDDIE